MLKVNRVTDPAKEKKLEFMAAQLAKIEATMDYVAMMADVEIPTENMEDESHVQED